MKPSLRAFTLIELAIVLSILIVMSGSVSRLFIEMEKVNRLARANLNNAQRAEIALEHIRADARGAVSVSSSAGVIHMEARDESLKPVTIEYAVEGGELLRKTTRPDDREQIEKIAAMNGALLIASAENGLLKLEWVQPGRMEPGRRRGARLVVYLDPGEVKP
ncbi:MAG: hypothetical protein GC154_14670 [bacterium]|nr:hypothetical protein [bacterium]